ncbi:SMC-Scp complex subunit ScpB [Edaphobacter aggregans]|uniref:SMC-Scp complex subunit ScpB n=1 Tax=Edaphobacter aggregans TaxID=570835 RepID=UPI000557BBBF|nr:SMC-Scp complex subunit ScpB [Edaphobacter aggregans]
MSLKAKIEAVIYASEEPVTLAQLMGLLGHEAQAELDQIAAAQQALALSQNEEGDAQGIDPDALNAEVLEGPVEAAAAEQPNAASEGAAVESSPAEEAPAQQAEPAQEEDAEKRSAREAKEEKEKTRRLREYFRTMLDQLIADYANGDRGLEIREVASGYRLATKPEYHDAVRGFVKSLKPPLKLSLQALETLAVVAYKQPITAPEVSEIRGVDSGGVLGSLMSRKLVTTAGRKQVIGRPILYKTTKDFLLRFGLKDINELPSIEEFEKMAGELAEQEEIPMEQAPEHQAPEHQTPEHHAPETPDELQAERHTHLPQADGSPDPVDDPLDDQLPDEPETEAEAKVEAEPVE